MHSRHPGKLLSGGSNSAETTIAVRPRKNRNIGSGERKIAELSAIKCVTRGTRFALAIGNCQFMPRPREDFLQNCSLYRLVHRFIASA